MTCKLCLINYNFNIFCIEIEKQPVDQSTPTGPVRPGNTTMQLMRSIWEPFSPIRKKSPSKPPRKESFTDIAKRNAGI